MRAHRSFVVVCSLAMVVGVGPPAKAVPGDLDPSFSSDGIRYVNGVALSDVVVQPDGKIVAVGRTTGAVPKGVAHRYTAGGDLDPTFSGDGRAPLRIGSPAQVTLQPDGRIVVAGLTGTGETDTMAVERLTAQGARDLTFSLDGWATARASAPWHSELIMVAGLAIDTLGRITVLVMSLEYPDNVDLYISLLVQWEPNGARRWTFGNDGTAWARRCDEPGGLAVQADRKLVVAGVGSYFGPDSFDPCLTRLNTNGTLDGTFGARGSTILGVGWVDARGVHVSPTDGSITALHDMEGGQVARVLPTGQPDPTFGIGGVATSDPNDGAEWRDVDLQGRKVVLVGSHEGLAVARLTATGALDTTFSADGTATVADLPVAHAVDVRGGAIVAVGTTATGSVIVRFVA